MTTTMHLAARCAVEYLQLTGERTRSRLIRLVEDYARFHGLTGEHLEEAKTQALAAARRIHDFNANA